MSLASALTRRFSRIGLRLFAFNLLVIFVPVAGVLYLDVYEARLRQMQEASLIQQARLLAAALGDRPELAGDDVSSVFRRFELRSEARFRVYGPHADVLADSARHAVSTPAGDYASSGTDERGVRRRRLYRLGAWLVQLPDTVRTWFRQPDASSSGGDDTVPAEVRAALAGRYGATTKPTPGQRSLTMYSAVPVRHQGAITGAVVASQSTFRILTALYAVRLRAFEVVLASLIAAALLTAIAATTIVRPLGRLRRQASALAERRGALPEVFIGAGRRDEIGALAVALGELSRRTNDHIRLLQSFSADVSHELKNPLASIRTAAEMMADSEAPEQRRRFLALMTRDVARLERLVSGLRDVARVEGQIEADVTEPVNIARLLDEIVSASSAGARARIALTIRDATARVIASRERLAQVLDNLIANALSFAPDGSTIAITLRRLADEIVLTVEDEGPGVPEGHLDRVFDRFFTYRPSDPQREHVGLGLAIAKQIVESYGGSIQAANRNVGGAVFTVRMPASDMEDR
jgi:two-component system, OmpR family, sensor histidine kinase ChvG